MKNRQATEKTCRTYLTIQDIQDIYKVLLQISNIKDNSIIKNWQIIWTEICPTKSMAEKHPHTKLISYHGSED